MQKAAKFFILFFPFLLNSHEITKKDWGAIRKGQYENWQEYPRTYLVSYPRSGNTWMRYCLEYLTKRPTTFSFSEVDPIHTSRDDPLSNTLSLMIDYSKSSIIKVHGYHNEVKIQHPSDRIIVMVRNYKECIHRRYPRLKDMISEIRREGSSYYTNLQAFDQFEPTKRLLVYYEDFIKDPQRVLEEILLFLEEDDALLEGFIKDLSFHKKRSLEHYDKGIGVSKSKGDDLHFHSAQLTPDERKRIDFIVKRMNPMLFQKYLQRYEED